MRARSVRVLTGAFACALATLPLLFVGCAEGPEADVEEPASTSEQAIIGGTATSSPEVVNVNGGCTGTLLSGSWVLTARHCVPGAAANPPPANPSMSVSHATLGSRNVSRAFYMPGNFNYDSANNIMHTPETDVALLQFDSPFEVDIATGSALAFLYPYANAGLVGSKYWCAGIGWTKLNGSTGTMNANSVAVGSTSGSLITMVPDSSGSAIQAPGDSGGPCERYGAGVYWTFRVQSSAYMNKDSKGNVTAITSTLGAGTESFRHWALATMGLGVGLFSDSNYSGKVQTIAGSTAALGIGNDALSSIKVPAGWSVRLWDNNPPTSGSYLDVTGNLASMPSGWNDRISYVEVRSGGVRIFSDANFQGRSATLTPGRYDVDTIVASVGNDAMSSIKIPADWRVKLYTDAGFSGRSVTLYASDLSEFGPWNGTWNDQISSMIVEQPAYVFVDSNYGGKYQALWEGDFTDKDLVIGNDSISSVIVPANLKVQFFQDNNFQAPSTVATTASSLGSWNDRVSSIRVTANP